MGRHAHGAARAAALRVAACVPEVMHMLVLRIAGRVGMLHMSHSATECSAELLMAACMIGNVLSSLRAVFPLA